MSRKASPAGEGEAAPSPESPRRRRGRPSAIAEVRPYQKPLRVTERDEALLALLRPYMAGVTNESEQAYTLVREGLLMRLAALAALGAHPPDAPDEEILATHAAQQLLLILPLLRRTGKLSLLGIDVSTPQLGAERGEPEDDGHAQIGIDDLDEQGGLDAEGLSGGLI